MLLCILSILILPVKNRRWDGGFAKQTKFIKHDESYFSAVPSTWYKKQEKKEEQEVQDTLTLKSGGKSYIRKCQQF